MIDEDPYKILGIRRGAVPSEIRAAYLKQAKENHPDLHSDKSPIERNAYTQQFQRVQAAYDLLTDAEERAYFDSHGKVRRRRNIAELSPAEKRLADLLNQTMQPMKQDVLRTNYLQMIGDLLRKKRDEHLFEAEGMAVCLEQVRKMQGRFKRQGDPENALATIIRLQVEGLTVEIESKRRLAADCDEALEEVKLYTYDLVNDPRLLDYNVTFGLTSGLGSVKFP